MKDFFKRNLSMFLLLTVVGLQFFIYLGSVFLTTNLSKCLDGYTNLKSNLPYLMDWVWVTVIGRIIGAYIVCKLAKRIGFFCVMRIIIIAYILLTISVITINFTDTFLYKDIQFLFIHRSINAFIIPSTFMLPSLFLLNQMQQKPIMISAYTCLAIGLGTLLIYKYLAIIQFADGWQNALLYAAILMVICYVFFEKYTPKNTPHTPPSTSKLDFGKIFLISVFGGTCGITFSYHFAFIDSYVNNSMICGNCENASFSYYYYAILISIIPVARFIYKKNLFTPLKLSVIGVNLIAIIIAIIPEITLNIYIAEQILFGILATILLVPCHALVYEIFKNTTNYFEGMFWYVTFFSLFAITPHFFLKLLGINSLPWLSLLYMVPISLLFIFALSRYEQKTTQANFNLETN